MSTKNRMRDVSSAVRSPPPARLFCMIGTMASTSSRMGSDRKKSMTHEMILSATPPR